MVRALIPCRPEMALRNLEILLAHGYPIEPMRIYEQLIALQLKEIYDEL